MSFVKKIHETWNENQNKLLGSNTPDIISSNICDIYMKRKNVNEHEKSKTHIKNKND